MRELTDLRSKRGRRRRDRVSGRDSNVRADGMELYFLLFLLAMLGFYLVGVGAYDDPHGRGINTYAKHVCWRRRDRGRTSFAREES